MRRASRSATASAPRPTPTSLPRRHSLYQPCDMPDDVLAFCIDAARRHLGPIAVWQKEGDAAVERIKAELDAAFQPAWQVIAGKHFGSRVTHDARNFTMFYLGDKAVCIFKCG